MGIRDIDQNVKGLGAFLPYMHIIPFGWKGQGVGELKDILGDWVSEKHKDIHLKYLL